MITEGRDPLETSPETELFSANEQILGLRKLIPEAELAIVNLEARKSQLPPSDKNGLQDIQDRLNKSKREFNAMHRTLEELEEKKRELEKSAKQ